MYVKNERGEYRTVDSPIEGAVHYKWISGNTYERVDVGSGSSGAGGDDSWKDWKSSTPVGEQKSEGYTRKVEVRGRFDEADHERERERIRREGLDVLDIRYRTRQDEHDPWAQSSGWSSSGWTSGWRGSRSDPRWESEALESRRVPSRWEWGGWSGGAGRDYGGEHGDAPLSFSNGNESAVRKRMAFKRNRNGDLV